MKWRYWILMAVGVVLVGAAWWWGGADEESSLRVVPLERQDVVQEAAFTGRLQAAERVELAFELGGAVTDVAVEEGDRVEAGQVLARIDTSAAQLEVAKAAADKYSGQEKAELSWQQAQEAADKTKAENARMLERRRQAVRDAKAELDQKKVIHQQSAEEDGDDSKLAETAYASVLTAQTAYHGAQQALEEALKTVAKSNAAAADAAETARLTFESTEQASGSVSGLSSLEALEALASVPLTKSVLTAPMSGVVTRREIEVGEVAQVGKTALELQTPDALEVVAEVAETDAAKIEVGMQARLTFDALTETAASQGQVTYIAPAAEIIEGVPTYLVKLAVESAVSGLKPGLTTNVTVHAREVANVLAVPRRAVIDRQDRQMIRIMDDGVVREIEVSTGLVGSDGLVEVAGPLTEGMTVIISRPDDRD